MVRRELSRQSRHSGSSTGSSHSNASDNSHSTTPPMYSERSLLMYEHDGSGIHLDHLRHMEDKLEHHDVRSSRSSFGSINTYASTSPSEEDLTRQSKFQVSVLSHDVYASDGIPSTPADFADLFPSNRRLLIHHDDTTSDGNMSLRVDTEIHGSDGRSRKLILFHLQMHDLKDRRFSLRRYCRESGREICSSTRSFANAPPCTSARTNIPKSLGHAFQQLRLNYEGTVSNKKTSARYDSGPASTEGIDYGCSPVNFRPSGTYSSSTNMIQLEFANYAHIGLNKRGLKRTKRYEYEFWGTKYEWKRHIYPNGHFDEISYHLISDKTSKSIAHITPELLTAREVQEEEDFGGWVPPCSMRITDRSVFRGLTDVADTIVATGLIALVDDCIDRRWHNKRSFHLELPIQEAADDNGPDQLIDKIFNRANTPYHTY